MSRIVTALLDVVQRSGLEVEFRANEEESDERACLRLIDAVDDSNPADGTAEQTVEKVRALCQWGVVAARDVDGIHETIHGMGAYEAPSANAVAPLRAAVAARISEFEALCSAFRPCVDPSSVQRSAFVADLEMVVANLRELQAKGLAACPEPNGDPRREGKWEGSYLMLMGILRDELEPMLEAWKGGGQFSRVGEELIANITTDP